MGQCNGGTIQEVGVSKVPSMRFGQSALSMGAFSVAGTMESGVSPKERKQGSPLPAVRAGRVTPWTHDTLLYRKNGDSISFGAYLAKVLQRGVETEVTEAVCSMCEVCESSDFKYPFAVVVTTLGAILTPGGNKEFSPESMYPLAAEHANYAAFKDWLKAPTAEFAELLNMPILIHVGKPNPKLCFCDWSVPEKAFWDCHPGGPCGWRVLSSSALFELPGQADVGTLKVLIKESNTIYDHLAARSGGWIDDDEQRGQGHDVVLLGRTRSGRSWNVQPMRVAM